MTVAEAARQLGLKSPGSLRIQISRGALHAEKHGRDWAISEVELERYRRENLGKRGNYDHKTAIRTPRPTAHDADREEDNHA